MAAHLRTSRAIRRETHQDYRGKPLLIEIGPDGVFLWPKGTRQKVKVNLEAAYERALAGRTAPLPTGRQLGMTRRIANTAILCPPDCHAHDHLHAQQQPGDDEQEYPGGMLAGTGIPLFNGANTAFVEQSNRECPECREPALGKRTTPSVPEGGE